MHSRAYKTLVSLPPLLWVGLFLLLPYALMFAHSFWAVHDGVLVHQWNLHNYVTLFSKPIYAALEHIPRPLVEASHDLGAGSVQTFLRVILPLSIPGLLAGATFAFVLSLGDFLAPLLVGGASGTMIANVVQSLFGAAYDWPLGAALSVCILIITISLLFLSERLQKRWSFQLTSQLQPAALLPSPFMPRSSSSS